MAAMREVEAANTKPTPSLASTFSVETASEMVRVALQDVQDVPAVAGSVSAAGRAAICEVGAEPYLYGCGEGNPACCRASCPMATRGTTGRARGRRSHRAIQNRLPHLERT